MAINMSANFYVLILVCHLVSASASNTSQAISCPGDVLTTECAITGGTATVWLGTAFHCAGNKIVLRHSLFGESYNLIRSCNNGAIVTRALGAVNDSYISQLSVTVSLELNNTTVECWQYSIHLHVFTFIRSIQIFVLATGK